MRWALLLVVGLVAGLLWGCASDGPDVNDVAASPLKLRAADERAQDQEEPDGECRHEWRATGFHPYTNMSTGIPFTDLCTIQTCMKCGATRHECARQARRRR